MSTLPAARTSDVHRDRTRSHFGAACGVGVGARGGPRSALLGPQCPPSLPGKDLYTGPPALGEKHKPHNIVAFTIFFFFFCINCYAHAPVLKEAQAGDSG